MSRAIRRQQERNKKAKIRKIMKEVWLATRESTVPMDERQASMLDPKNVGRIATTPHSCQSLCCKNPRRWHKGRSKLTIQELRHES